MSEAKDDNSRTLYNNNITNFILRIDFNNRFKYDIDDVVRTFQDRFDKTETRLSHPRINLKQHEEKLDANVEYITNTVFIDEREKCLLTFSPEPPSIVFETRRYVCNTIYKDLFQKLSDYFSSKYPEELSVRIGMRYTNTFSVNTDRDFSKYLKPLYSRLVRSISNNERLCRTFIQQETVDDGNRIRVLYGLINKYYPSVIVSKDLTIDIDSFIDGGILFKDWSETLKALNHAAYDTFEEMVNPKYIESLRKKNG